MIELSAQKGFILNSRRNAQNNGLGNGVKWFSIILVAVVLIAAVTGTIFYG